MQLNYLPAWVFAHCVLHAAVIVLSCTLYIGLAGGITISWSTWRKAQISRGRPRRRAQASRMQMAGRFHRSLPSATSRCTAS